MNIKLLTSIAGTDYVFNYGDIVKAPDEVGKRMIERDQAEPAPKGAHSVGEIPSGKKKAG